MGHDYKYKIFPYNTKKETMRGWAADWYSGHCDREEQPDGNYNNRFELYDKCFKSEQEAENWIEQNLTNYRDGAVSFYEYPKKSDNKTMEKIKKRGEELIKKAKKYLEDHCVENQKAKLISCECCGSKINMKYKTKNYSGEKVGIYKDGINVYNQQCPICGKDLRADYIITKQKEYEDAINMLNKKYEFLKKEQNEKQIKKAKKMWLAKAECHI